ncbi:DUF190 domain-containing protein [Micromonospora aurantiaca (nom. illeg.)]
MLDGYTAVSTYAVEEQPPVAAGRPRARLVCLAATRPPRCSPCTPASPAPAWSPACTFGDKDTDETRNPATRPTVFVGEDDTWQHNPRYHEIVPRAHATGLAGADGLRGINGFGPPHGCTPLASSRCRKTCRLGSQRTPSMGGVIDSSPRSQPLALWVYGARGWSACGP